MNARFDAFSIVTADLPASLDFYRRLGLDIPAGAEEAPHVEAGLPGGLRLLWDTEEVIGSFDKEWRPPAAGAGERTGLAFRCDTPGEVDRVYGELTGAGYRGHLEPWDAVWGQRYAVVLDPDGLGVSLFADAPGAGGDSAA
jgi:catechol 2,3-dioxygenase-like lactoylglutathione lyase family enzyme